MTITCVDFAVRAVLNAVSRSAIDFDLHRFRPKSARVGDEIDLRHRLVPHVAQKVVERRAAGRLLQPIDAAEAPIVVDDDDELFSQHHRSGDLRVHHEIRTIAEDDQNFAVRQSRS